MELRTLILRELHWWKRNEGRGHTPKISIYMSKEHFEKLMSTDTHFRFELASRSAESNRKYYQGARVYLIHEEDHDPFVIHIGPERK